MKNQVNPVVVVIALVAAVAAIAFIGYRAVNSTPKLTYPKDFNPAQPPGVPGARR